MIPVGTPLPSSSTDKEPSLDYVVAKLTEFKLLDDKAFEEAKLKYSDIITARANAREKINEITEQLKDFADII